MPMKLSRQALSRKAQLNETLDQTQVVPLQRLGTDPMRGLQADPTVTYSPAADRPVSQLESYAMMISGALSPHKSVRPAPDPSKSEAPNRLGAGRV